MEILLVELFVNNYRSNMLYFITSNKRKLDHARPFLKKHNIEIIEENLPITEIQSDSIEEITKNKAEQAFAILKKPLLITDHGWFILGLNGFPGPYMKYMNEWLTPQNFLDLTKNLTDRRILLQQVVCYKDQNSTKLFIQEDEGILLKEIRGNSYDSPAMTIVSYRKGYSNAEAREKGIQVFDTSKLWKEFAEWYESLK